MNTVPQTGQMLRTWRRDERGNVAMMMALSLVPLLMGSMGALDLTRGIAAKVELQDALDAAALAAGRSNTNDAAQLQAIGQRVLTANLGANSDFAISSSSFTFGDNGAVIAQAEATFTPTLSGLLGGRSITIGASAEVTRANDELEIALVLDNTGSMGDPLGKSSGSKISYLKTAATDFVNIMSGAAAQSTIPNSIRISLVPFASTVNIGAAYSSAAWINSGATVPTASDDLFTITGPGDTQTGVDRWQLFSQTGANWAGCVEMRRAPYDIQDTAPTNTVPDTLFTPYFAPDDDDDTGSNDYATDPKKDARGNTANWWGQQGSTSKYANVKRWSLNTSIGPNRGCTMQAVQRLTTDFTTLKSAINKMVASGTTNIPMGMVWGWHTLSPNTPFGDGVAYLTPKHKKIVVLMTDGENTLNSTGSNNYSEYTGVGYVWEGHVLDVNGNPLTRTSSTTTRTAALDDRLKKLCANMKAPNVDIEIYTIGVGVTSASKTLLTNCATDAAHYFDVTDGVDMSATFQNIANQIAQLHLSK